MTEKQKIEEKPEEQKFDAVAARELLQEEQASRERACSAAIQRVLQQHGCNIFGVAQITPDGRIVAQIQIRSVSVV